MPKVKVTNVKNRSAIAVTNPNGGRGHNIEFGKSTYMDTDEATIAQIRSTGALVEAVEDDADIDALTKEAVQPPKKAFYTTGVPTGPVLGGSASAEDPRMDREDMKDVGPAVEPGSEEDKERTERKGKEKEEKAKEAMKRHEEASKQGGERRSEADDSSDEEKASKGEQTPPDHVDPKETNRPHPAHGNTEMPHGQTLGGERADHTKQD